MSLERLQSTVLEISQKHEVGCCEHCKGPNSRLWPSMTAYDTSDLNLEFDDNPNAHVFLCHCCHDDYVDYWTEMWNEYKSSQGG